MSARYVCRHGLVEPADAEAASCPWCEECEAAPHLTDPDVAPLRKQLEAWHPPSASGARDFMALEIAARRRAEKALASLRRAFDEATA